MTTDPRKVPGDIAGPGGPQDKAGVILDTRHAVLMDAMQVAMADNPSDKRRFIALLLSGRINQSLDYANVLFLFDADGAAGLIVELLGIAEREGEPFKSEMHQLIQERLAELP